jgi:hypothetical protein
VQTHPGVRLHADRNDQFLDGRRGQLKSARVVGLPFVSPTVSELPEGSHGFKRQPGVTLHDQQSAAHVHESNLGRGKVIVE